MFHFTVQCGADSRVTQDIYKHIHSNGFFQLETSEQTYCEDDQLFLADRFVEGTCPNCGYDVSNLCDLKLTAGRTRRPV